MRAPETDAEAFGSVTPSRSADSASLEPRDKASLRLFVQTLLARGEVWRAEILLAEVLRARPDASEAAEWAIETAKQNDSPALGYARALVAHAAQFDADTANAIAVKLTELGFRREAARLLAPHAATHGQSAQIVAKAASTGAPENRSTASWRQHYEKHRSNGLKVGLAYARADELEYARAAAALTPSKPAASAKSYQHLLNLLERTGQYGAWGRLIDEIESAFPADDWIAEQRQRYEFAATDWRKRAGGERLAPTPGDLDGMRKHAAMLATQGQDEAAAEAWGDIARREGRASDQYEHVVALFRANAFDAARAALDAAAKRYPGDYRLQLKWAQLHERANDYGAALQSFTKALALEPGNLDSNAGIARCLTYLERFDQAEAWIAQFPQQSIADGWVHSARAFNEARAGNRLGAATALDRLRDMLAAFEREYEERRAADPASVWLNGKFVSHPAAAAALHGAGFAADMADMRAAASLVLVGNSPRLIGAGLGRAIDSTDFVIRLNDFTTDDYEADVGRRTDLWYSSANRVARPNADGVAFQRIWLLQPQAPHFPELPAYALARLGLTLTEANTRYLPPHAHSLTMRLIYPRPSSGFRMIALLEFLLRRPYKIAGFSHFADAEMHYFDRDERRLPVGEMHAISFERDFVEDVLAPCGLLQHL